MVTTGVMHMLKVHGKGAWQKSIRGLSMTLRPIPFPRSRAFALPVALAAAVAQAELEARDSLEMEVGGLLTLDAGNRLRDWENTPARLGRVELSAKVEVHPQMEGAITLVSEDNPESIAIDQAVGQWKIGTGALVFGQQYFNVGLLTTRLISDPLILEMAEFAQAGLTGLWQYHDFNLGAGLTSLTTGPDSATVSDPCLVLNSDWNHAQSLLRLSSQWSRHLTAVDAAANISIGPIWIDLEAYWRLRNSNPNDGILESSEGGAVNGSASEDLKAKGGYFAGLAADMGRGVEIAVRWDGLASESDVLVRQRFSGGITLTWLGHVFGAAEVGYAESEGAVFAVQMGLRSDLKLPGFQRKTLVK